MKSATTTTKTNGAQWQESMRKSLTQKHTSTWHQGKMRLLQPQFFPWMRGSRVKLKSIKIA